MQCDASHMAPPETKMSERPASAGKVRLAPLRRPSAVRKVRDDAAERVLACAHKHDAHSAEHLAELCRGRHARVVARVTDERATYEGDRETLRYAVRDEIQRVTAVMEAWLDSRADCSKVGILGWLSKLPAALRANPFCAGSLELSDVDVEWLMRKGVAALGVLLTGEEEQRAHAVRRGVAPEEMPGFLERVGCLREGFVPSHPGNDWLSAFADAKISPRDVVEYLCALFIYTASCRSRATVEGWEQCADDEWTDAPPPKRPAVHGPNSSPWAVMNWTLRTAHDPTQPQDVRIAAEESSREFDYLEDRINEALAVLPKERDVVLRGVGVHGLAYRYAVGHTVVFPPFTSTSALAEDARAYAKSDGTFFIVRSHSAARIDFVSHMPAEAEKLLPSFSHFTVLSKGSSMVLRRLECPHDFIALAEHGDDVCTDAVAVDIYLRSARHAQFAYAHYLKEAYIEGRIAPVPPPCDVTTPVFTYLREWLSGTEHLLLLGPGGSGKTSATLAALCVLSAMEDIAPVFIPLSTVRELFADGGLDRHVCQLLQLTPSQVELLARTKALVLLLDSLDEIPISACANADVRLGVTRLLQRNPLASTARVLLSSRDEFLILNGIQPTEVFGASGLYGYVQPFSLEDAGAFVERQCALSNTVGVAAAEKRRTLGDLMASMGDVMLTPCVLYMACRVDDERLRAIMRSPAPRLHPSRVYEAYVAHALDGEDHALEAMHKLALVMLDQGDWQTTIGDVVRTFGLFGVDPDIFRRRYLPRIPRRVENDADDSGVFAWWHKSVGEYLAARAFWSSPLESLATVSRPFSLDAPAVLSFFGALAANMPFKELRDLDETLVSSVVLSRESRDSATLAVASNALSLLCAASHLLHRTDLSNIVIESANLEGALLQHTSLAGATFRRCRLYRASLDYADIHDAVFPHSTCEAVLAPLEGHSRGVVGVCFAPNCDSLWTASLDGSVREWDTMSGMEKLALGGRSGALVAVAFSSDGSVIAAAMADGGLRLFEAETGKALRSLSGHTEPALAVCFSPKDAVVASGSADRTVRVWSLSSAEPPLVIQGHEGAVNSVAFSPDGKLVASAADDRTCRVWDVQTGKEVCALYGHSDSVRCVRFAPDGSGRIATCSKDKSVRMWDLESGRELLSMWEHRGTVNVVCFSPDAKFVASGGADRTVRVWAAATGRKVQILEGHTGGVACLCFSHNGRLLASGSEDATARVWDASMPRDVRTVVGHSQAVNCVRFSPDGTLLASTSDDRTVSLWESATGREVATLTGHKEATIGANFSRDGRLLATTSADNTVRVWDVTTGGIVCTIAAHTNAVVAVSFSPDGRLVATGSEDRTLRMFEVRTGGEKFRKEFQKVVTDATFSPNGDLLAGCTNDVIILWDAWTGDNLGLAFTGHNGPISSIRFAPDGGILASGGDDGTVRLWDVASGHELHTLSGHAAKVTCVCFSPNGMLLASCSCDRTVRVWDVSHGTELLALEGHAGAVNCVSFSPDGLFLASGSMDKAIRVWDLEAAISEVPAEGEEAPADPLAAVNAAARSLRLLISRSVQFSASRCKGLPEDCEGSSHGLLACFVADDDVVGE